MSDTTRSKAEVCKSVVTHRACSFGCNPLAPMCGVDPVTDSDFLDRVHGLAKETAIADQFVFRATDDSKLRWSMLAITRKNPFQKASRLLGREHAERERCMNCE